ALARFFVTFLATFRVCAALATPPRPLAVDRFLAAVVALEPALRAVLAAFLAFFASPLAGFLADFFAAAFFAPLAADFLAAFLAFAEAFSAALAAPLRVVFLGAFFADLATGTDSVAPIASSRRLMADVTCSMVIMPSMVISFRFSE